jgi:hypothetical protein
MLLIKKKEKAAVTVPLLLFVVVTAVVVLVSSSAFDWGLLPAGVDGAVYCACPSDKYQGMSQTTIKIFK